MPGPAECLGDVHSSRRDEEASRVRVSALQLATTRRYDVGKAGESR